MISISYRLLTRMGTILLGRAIGSGESASLSLSLGSVWLVVVLRFFELAFRDCFVYLLYFVGWWLIGEVDIRPAYC
jgi:hypothetical protein